MNKLKSPLRYPGGKQKALSKIEKYLPMKISEFREPFVGGGSVFLYVKSNFECNNFWINDLNPELYFFWKILKENPKELVEAVSFIKNIETDGRKLFNQLAQADTQKMTDLERATRFFVLNRITFSGTIESGGYSEASFHSRFTKSSIQRLLDLENTFADVKVSNLDYSLLLNEAGKDVFIFLDPPYLSKTQSRLYGKKGNLHIDFDHVKFAQEMEKCTHKWLITYDDCQEIRDNFSFAYIYEWELQYGMNNYKQSSAKKGKELFISNYFIG
ncbi:MULTISPECIES: DNA adenine methylase [unclassified Synechocystis]|uniref:DNA adenine methylase n=1 Tax=unclassified Synechocystis TaxID=2640012 RepID=UPI0004165CAD|nr:MULTISPECIES: DNA adenine methylase [unclassified Synechocystis]AIE72681.1 DNA methyltransferase [Synechocystis sp. PCC 6714]MCT0254662.1 DNA adenine methylase [Synechocystis sp. CS-94]